MSHNTSSHDAVVTAEGHLVDSQILKSIFDRVIERGGAFEVPHFDLGRTNEDAQAASSSTRRRPQSPMAYCEAVRRPKSTNAVRLVLRKGR